MAASESEIVDRNDESQTDDKYTEKQIFNFKSLQIDDSAIKEESCSASDSSLKRLGTDVSLKQQQQSPSMATQEKSAEPTKTYKFLNKFVEKKPSLQGNWRLFCTTEPDGSGRSEANAIWTSIQEMHESRQELFPIKPYTFKKDNGTLAVCCCTPDYTDKAFILNVVRAIREIISYPYVMYYHKRIGKLTSFYMHTPDDEFYVNVEGSWTLEEL